MIGIINKQHKKTISKIVDDLDENMCINQILKSQCVNINN